MDSKKNGVNIISARSLFEKAMPSKNSLFLYIRIYIYSDGFKEWKFRTFNTLGEMMDKDLITNIIAIGDSQIEIDAAT